MFVSRREFEELESRVEGLERLLTAIFREGDPVVSRDGGEVLRALDGRQLAAAVTREQHTPPFSVHAGEGGG